MDDPADLNRVILLERRKEFARVASGPNNNSQTIHCGDIETNYTAAKAGSVQRLAHMLRNFATKLPEAERQQTIAKMQKMAIGVGEEECAFMEKRYKDFKPVFPKMQLLNKEQIAKVEPAVAYSNMGEPILDSNMSTLSATRHLRPEKLVANYVADEYSAVDYFHLTNNMVKLGEKERGKRDVR